MKLESVHSVYFLGIGGIGMSAIARWFHANGYTVSGYDKTATVLTKRLEAEGIAIHYSDDVEQIPAAIKADKSTSLIIYTPAVPQDLKELIFFQNEGYVLHKRSQVLGMLTESKFTIAVAGTHGKTTTSSMVAHLLKSVGVDCSAFVGGIMTNYDSNLLIGTNNDVMVVEADEFDRSFLTLHPDIAIITATDADHLDIYGDRDALKDSFKAFIQNMKKNGTLFLEEKVAQDLDAQHLDNVSVFTYGLEGGDIQSKNLTIDQGDFCFDFQSKDRQIKDLRLSMSGFHNVSNAIAALAATVHFEANNAPVQKGLESYRGVKRRFEYILKTDDCVFIDDYAHHPEEIKALLHSVRAIFPTKKMTVVFQPHLYSRTRDFMDGFAESLSLADQVLLLDIYPARELPIPGVTSEVIKEKMTTNSVLSFHKDDVLGFFDANRPELVLTVGAGDIDTLVQPIKEKLEK
ncbi:UDP-N-acetylmuramate--L-alanine ligase [Reichenbachiella agariperforans]|uniref:UDP-N-acetylmuramate--L-alanine ligase n=1 Tax=Reichenbachiella agariperforans TaxID=156994 RepID=A0A1M6LJL3_REIAG|nr:UDP-N-acetylmuramate--L-alanine ligase [Reichenbachiella agariperforans]SHJ71396.1 UDP-N-acetylmuramate--L-alanine ligase [Reichenbachiella agariperforans]